MPFISLVHLTSDNTLESDLKPAGQVLSSDQMTFLFGTKTGVYYTLNLSLTCHWIYFCILDLKYKYMLVRAGIGQC